MLWFTTGGADVRIYVTIGLSMNDKGVELYNETNEQF